MSKLDTIKSINYIIKKETGIVIDDDRLVDLEIVINSRLIFHNMKPDNYTDFIKKNYEEIIFVASCFTIQETSFYRYKAHFDRLKFEVIPDLISKCNNGNKKISILSAGCATGEEPYTIAMLLYDLLQNYEDWDISIVATDINENALSVAKDGAYSEYKLRNIDKWYVDKFFKKTESGKNIIYYLDEKIKKMVEFRHCNLIREPFELSDIKDIDIIFCENVIIYFCIDSIQRLINNFYNLLKDDGYLFLGYSETLNFINHKFVLSWWNDSFVFKKGKKEPEDISYNLKDFALKDDIIKDETFSVNEKNYNDIIQLVINNYNEEMSENINRLLRKIENSKIKIDEMFYIIKAEFRYDRKDFINSTNECRKAININPHSIDAHIILGAIYLELNMLDSSSFELKTALYIDKTSILANYYFALFNKIIGNDAEYKLYLNIAKRQLEENKGVFETRLYPLNKKSRQEIYNNIVNL